MDTRDPDTPDAEEPRAEDQDALDAESAGTPESQDEAASAEELTSTGKLSRRDVLRYGGTAVGGAVIGAFAGYQIGGSSDGGSDGKPAGDRTPVETWKVGAVIPKKAPYLGEGQETSRGLDLGLKVVNGRGGLAGKEVELVTEEVADLTEASMTAAAQSLAAKEVVAVFLGFTSPTCSELSTYVEYGAPVFHLSTSQASLDAVTEETTNIFRCVPAPVSWGPRFTSMLARIDASGVLRAGPRSVAIVTTDDPEGLALADGISVAVEQLGWSVSATDPVTTPVADWEPLLSQLRAAPPTALFLGVPTAPDLAAFQIAFAADPFPSLLYEISGPSVPEFRDLAGEAADGVLWSTPVGTIPDALSASFRDLYERKYGKSTMGYSQAGAQYDLVRFWTQAAALAKKPSKLSKVSKIVPEVVFRGVSGAFNLGNEQRTAVAFPGGTKDPSSGLPHLTFQIQGGKQVLLGPAPFVDGKFVKPDWI